VTNHKKLESLDKIREWEKLESEESRGAFNWMARYREWTGI